MVATIFRLQERPHLLIYKFELHPLTYILTQVLVKDFGLELSNRARPLQKLLLVMEQGFVNDHARFIGSEMIFFDSRLQTVLQVSIEAVLLVFFQPLT